MDKINLENGELRAFNLNDINVVLGRNGSGKSRFLRELARTLEGTQDKYKVNYISPERAGNFKFDVSTESNITSGPHYLKSERDKNHSTNFKNASAYFFKKIETAYLRRMEKDPEIRADMSQNFDSVQIDKYNKLLTNIKLERFENHNSFRFVDGENNEVAPEFISSGEAEVVSLATECLYFIDCLDFSKVNVLIIDEPDVHMHPDLQARFARFIINEVNSLDEQFKGKVIIILSTHSTPLVCELLRHPATNVGTKFYSNNEINFKRIDDKFVLASSFFGHPLSKVLSDEPLLIIEGEDDERVWQQAVRTAQGEISYYPCVAISVDQQTKIERLCSEMLSSIYDDPLIFSIRDGDGKKDRIDNEGCVLRFRLNCYAIENLLLTDEVLNRMGVDWVKFKSDAQEWINNNSAFKYNDLLTSVINDNDRAKDIKIKDIRDIICRICQVNKAWEVVVGQTIGNLAKSPGDFNLENSQLIEFIGRDCLIKLGFNLS